MTQTILIAPAGFKGTLRPREVSEALAQGARQALPHAVVLSCPVADGGDGLLDAVLTPASLREHVAVSGPLGTPVQAELGWIDAETAIFESASACGLALLSPDRYNATESTSQGVGELIVEANDRGARTVVVGLGGSACVDGGVGAARGLGWTFSDVNGAALGEGGVALGSLADWEPAWPLKVRVLARSRGSASPARKKRSGPRPRSDPDLPRAVDVGRWAVACRPISCRSTPQGRS